MANQNFILGPKMDWTEDPDLHRCFREWREKTELLVDNSTSAHQEQEYKIEICDYGQGKEARTYLNTLSEEIKGQSTDSTKYIRRVDETKSRWNCSLHTAQSSEPR